MNKTKIIFISLVLVLIIGCAPKIMEKPKPGMPPSFPPPPPIPQGPIGRAAAPGYAEPFDIYNNNAVVIAPIPQLKADPTTGVENINIQVTRQGGWIWQEAYKFNAKTFTWEKFTLSGTPYPGTQWIANSASKTLTGTPFDTVKIDQIDQNAVITFTCKQYGTDWKCGCTSTTETAPCLKWMMRTFTITRELPPTTPGGTPETTVSFTIVPPAVPSPAITPGQAHTTEIKLSSMTTPAYFMISNGIRFEHDGSRYWFYREPSTTQNIKVLYASYITNLPTIIAGFNDITENNCKAPEFASLYSPGDATTGRIGYYNKVTCFINENGIYGKVFVEEITKTDGKYARITTLEFGTSTTTLSYTGGTYTVPCYKNTQQQTVCKQTYTTTTAGKYTGSATPNTGWQVNSIQGYYSPSHPAIWSLTCTTQPCTFTTTDYYANSPYFVNIYVSPTGASPTATPTTMPTATPTPTVTPAGPYAHCSIDLEKYDGTLWKLGEQDITDVNAKQACIQLSTKAGQQGVFGKDWSNGLTTSEYDHNSVIASITPPDLAIPGDTPTLECKLPCYISGTTYATGTNLVKTCLNNFYDPSLPEDPLIYNTVFEDDLGINPETICPGVTPYYPTPTPTKITEVKLEVTRPTGYSPWMVPCYTNAQGAVWCEYTYTATISGEYTVTVNPSTGWKADEMYGYYPGSASPIWGTSICNTPLCSYKTPYHYQGTPYTTKIKVSPWTAPIATPTPSPTTAPIVQYVSEVKLTAEGAHTGSPTCPTDYESKGTLADCGGGACNGNQRLCQKSSSTEQPIVDVVLTAEGAHNPGGPACPDASYIRTSSLADCGGANCFGNQILCVKKSTTEPRVLDVVLTQEGAHIIGGPACPAGYESKGTLADCGGGACNGNQRLCVNKQTATIYTAAN